MDFEGVAVQIQIGPRDFENFSRGTFYPGGNESTAMGACPRQSVEKPIFFAKRARDIDEKPVRVSMAGKLSVTAAWDYSTTSTLPPPPTPADPTIPHPHAFP